MVVVVMGGWVVGVCGEGGGGGGGGGGAYQNAYEGGGIKTRMSS